MLKKFTLRILLIGLCALSTIQFTRASDLGIGVTLLNYTIDSTANDSINLGYTLTIYAQITNYDSVPFNGNINFGLRNEHEILSSSSIFDKPPYSGDSISLGGGQTVPAIFSVVISPQYFMPGPDVVVVWPICNWTITDSIVIHLTVLDPSGIANQNDAPFSYAVLSDRILLKSVNAQSPFKQVRIYNTIGQLLSEIQSNSITEVPIPELSSGIYLCELISADGKRNIIRFFH